MNNVKKVTAETVEEDFRRVLTFHLVTRIDYFFGLAKGGRKKYHYGKYSPPDYMAFWNARSEFAKFKERLHREGWQDTDYTHRVYDNLEKFDKCGLPPEVVEAIFKRIPNYGKITEKYLLATHGTMMVSDGNGGRKRIHYPNVYSPGLAELRSIFASRENFEKVANLGSGLYTARQKHLILVYILGMKGLKKQPGKRRGEQVPPSTVEDVRKAVRKQVVDTFGGDDAETWTPPLPPEEVKMTEEQLNCMFDLMDMEQERKAAD